MKRGLLSMLALALSFLGTLGVNAQTWTASAPEAGDFYLYNVGAGGYLVGANNWGTRASVSAVGGIRLTLAASGDGYTISTSSAYSNCFLGSNGYLDNGTAAAWTFVPVDGQTNVYKLQNGSNFLFAEAGTPTEYRTVALSVGADPGTEAAYFKIVSHQDRLADLESATKQSPKDATFLIKNPNFGRNAIIYWTMNASNQNLSGGTNENRCAESWCSTFTLSQVVSELPEGSFELNVQAALTDYTDAYDGANYPVAYANDNTAPFNSMDESGDRGSSMDRMSNSFLDGKYNVTVPFYLNEGQTATIGVRGTRTNTWCIWDNFRVSFLGFDMQTLVAAFDAAVADAQAIKGDMNADIAAALASALQACDGADKTDKASVRAAMAQLNTAVTDAKNSIATYQKIAAEIAAFKKAYAEGDATTMDEKYGNGTYESYEDFATDLQAAKVEALGQEDGTDYTDLLVNASPYANLDGWEYDRAPNAFDTGNRNAEYWSWNGSLNNSQFQQTLKDLPAGVYTLTAIALTREGMDAKIGLNGTESQIVTVASSTVNDRGQANNWFNAGNGINTVTVTLPKGGDLTAWLRSSSTGDGWTVWRSFSLTYNTIKDLVFVDAGTEKFEATKKNAGQYTDITATVTGGGELAGTPDNLKDGVRIVYENTDALNENLYTCGFRAEAEINDGQGTTYFVKAREIDGVIKLAQGLFGPSMNYTVTLKPIIYYNFDQFCDDDAATLSATYGLTLDACDPLPLWSSGNTYTFTIATNDKVKQDIQSLVKTNTVMAINAWGEDITAQLLNIGGTATGIDKVQQNTNGAIYNLAGQRVAKAQKGIYVVGGKKVAVK